MAGTKKFSFIDMVDCIVSSLKLANPELYKHSILTSRIAYSIGAELQIKGEQLRDLISGAALHCIGSLINNFEKNKTKYRSTLTDIYSRAGNQILSRCHKIKSISDIFACNHAENRHQRFSQTVCLQSDVIQMSCQIAHLLNVTDNALLQANRIKTIVKNKMNAAKNEAIQIAFDRVAEKDYFWLHLVHPSDSISKSRAEKLREFDISLTIKDLSSLATIIARMIDFKSPNTINHSYGVAVSAYYLGMLSGLSEEECERLKIAGYVHDIGKLAIPDEILYKPTKLTDKEFNIVKKHPYDTYCIIEKVKGLEDIRDWAAFHHEKPHGKGYPFNINSLKLSVHHRILTIADVFSALREDRMYRKRFAKEQVITELQKMFCESCMDMNIVNLLIKNYEKIELARTVAEVDSMNHYMELISATGGSIEADIYCALTT